MHKTLSKERIQQLRSVGGNRIWRFDTTVFWSLMKPWKFNSNDGGIYTYDMTYFQKLLLHNRASIIILSNPDYYLLFSWNPTSLRPVRHSRSQPGAGESSSHSCTFFADTPPPSAPHRTPYEAAINGHVNYGTAALWHRWPFQLHSASSGKFPISGASLSLRSDVFSSDQSLMNQRRIWEESGQGYVLKVIITDQIFCPDVEVERKVKGGRARTNNVDIALDCSLSWVAACWTHRDTHIQVHALLDHKHIKVGYYWTTSIYRYF